MLEANIENVPSMLKRTAAEFEKKGGSQQQRIREEETNEETCKIIIKCWNNVAEGNSVQVCGCSQLS